MNLWCEYQEKDKDGIYCTANINDGRVLTCPYKSPEEWFKAEYPCSDYIAIPNTSRNIDIQTKIERVGE